MVVVQEVLVVVLLLILYLQVLETLHQSHHHKEILVDLIKHLLVMVVLVEVVLVLLVLIELLLVHFLFGDLVRVEDWGEQHLVEILEFLHLMELLDQLQEDGLLEVEVEELTDHPREQVVVVLEEEAGEVQLLLLLRQIIMVVLDLQTLEGVVVEVDLVLEAQVMEVLVDQVL
jgi:hypothetical protein